MKKEIDFSKLNERRKKRIKEYYKNKIEGAELMVDNVFDVHNVAALSRSADGLGIEKINLYYTYNKFPDMKRNGKKSSSTANKWIIFDQILDLKKFVKERKKKGYTFIGAKAVKGAKNLLSYKFPKKCIVILGSESKGLSKEIEEICDDFVFIPMLGMVESYNVSVAGGLIMYELYKQKGKYLKLRF